ncbi:MAG: carboxymuconolactone decarboxylase family protein [Chloroflexi bacterium]|nr:carboxymuconolactone decarboxylase family protein [Chloroflexota bacterium]
MLENPLKTIERIDPELFQIVEKARSLALAEGVIPRKYRILIALALDAAHGAADGVTSLARQAIAAGATKEEIAETLRVAMYISGVGSTYTAAHALKDMEI